MKPFKIAGNLYFVGTKPASSHMIDTGDGLILIDVGYEQTADTVISSVSELGFDVKDVKYILLTHGHGDHSDGAPKVRALSGAKILIGREDVKYLNGFSPDGYLSDGQRIKLGNTEIECIFTPGHTEGTFSFFFNVEEKGEIYRVGTFGGAGTNQLKKDYLDKRSLSYLLRGQFFRSIERLRSEHVDIFIGNHSWHNHTEEKYEKSLTSSVNPFIDPSEWVPFLDKLDKKLEEIIITESREKFVNYAHRGASEYLPENTLLSFYTGIFMGANGIETDIRKTKDGVLVLFHDNTLERVMGESGDVESLTLEELRSFNISKNGYTDKIVTLEDFLEKFAFRDITFAIELKGSDVERETADLLRKYNMKAKTVVTSFKLEYIRKFREYAPEFSTGHLIKEISAEEINALKELSVNEICPRASLLTKENVRMLHREGFRVRAWGVGDEETMRHVAQCGADGMTVNFPDKLAEFLKVRG
ncbi:MAG: MBL fold metallo-hydrolase [Ruminococcaceae bacterium]|nr:MBL fold metallo-hydrolase [Oscillospiraceae bacterium]